MYIFRVLHCFTFSSSICFDSMLQKLNRLLWKEQAHRCHCGGSVSQSFPAGLRVSFLCWSSFAVVSLLLERVSPLEPLEAVLLPPISGKLPYRNTAFVFSYSIYFVARLKQMKNVSICPSVFLRHRQKLSRQAPGSYSIRKASMVMFVRQN